jgi:hypothetical protein
VLVEGFLTEKNSSCTTRRYLDVYCNYQVLDRLQRLAAKNLELNVPSQDEKYSIKRRGDDGTLKDRRSFVVTAMEQIAFDFGMGSHENRHFFCCFCAARSSSSAREASWSRFAEIILKQKDRLSVRWSVRKLSVMREISKDFENRLCIKPMQLNNYV